MHNIHLLVGIAAQPVSKGYSFGGGFSCSSSALEKYQLTVANVKGRQVGAESLAANQ
jgi:hypothetical protein